MTPDASDYSKSADSVFHDVFGLDRSHPSPDKIQITEDQLKRAVKASYLSGTRSSILQGEGVNTQLLFWQLLDTLPDNVYFKDLQSRFISINRAQAKFLGLADPNDAIGKSDFDFFDQQSALDRFESEQEIIKTGQGWSLHEEKDLVAEDGQVCLVSSKLPLRDKTGAICGTFGISRDVTTRYRAEREVERQRNLLEAIINILPLRIFVRDRDHHYITANKAYQESLGLKSVEEIEGRSPSEFFEPDFWKVVRAEDERIMNSGDTILNKMEYDATNQNEKRWVVVSKVPLYGPERRIEGIVGITHDINEQKVAEEESRRLGALLSEKNEQFEAELLVARQLQEKLMSIGYDQEGVFRKTGPNWNVHSRYFYKPSHHLAGDFFDIVPISENRLGVLVCDVMGHGIKASLVTMLLRGLILEMPHALDFPGSVLEQLNKSLCTLAAGHEFPRFVTAVYMMLDLDNGFARIANAGHPKPLWETKADDGRAALEACPGATVGPALGLIEDETFEQAEFRFEQLTELLFYTDGIVEQKDAMGNEFGIQKLEQILLNRESKPLSDMLETVNTVLKLTAGSEEYDDDICLVALRIDRNA